MPSARLASDGYLAVRAQRRNSARRASASKWHPGVQYVMGDAREYEGDEYECTAPHRSVSGFPPPVDADRWRLVGGDG